MNHLCPPREFLSKKHAKFFQRCLQILPARYASMETSRMTAAFFAISGLDMMNCLDVLKKDKTKIIQWIYSLQVHPNISGSNLHQCGFRGSHSLAVDTSILEECPSAAQYDSAHVAMTYTALLTLLILGDDLSGVDHSGVLTGVRHLQRSDGSFCSTPEGSENDMRFVYCASCICYILDDWSGMDQTMTLQYIKSSLTYEGAFAQGPGLEAHGGSTFCAVASLVLMGRLHSCLSPRQLDQLRRWCILRQVSGFQGRPGKPVDTCYSFWVGATLQLLDIYHMTDPVCNRGYLMDTQDPMVGGFAKWPDNTPDPLHAYFGLCGLSLMGEPSLKCMHPSLNISLQAASHLEQLQQRWSVAKATALNNQPLPKLTVPDNSPCCGTEQEQQASGDRLTNGQHKPGPCVPDGVSHKSAKDFGSESGPVRLHMGTIGPPGPDIGPPLARDQHITFFKSCLHALPSSCQSVDASRLTIVCFAVSALDLLTPDDSIDRAAVLEWIYSLQVHTTSQDDKDVKDKLAGFSGSPCVQKSSNDLDTSHLAMTYFALCSLVVLRDDLSKVKRADIIHSLKGLQTSDGCFRPCSSSSQTDIKSLYWALGISYLLKDWSGINVYRAVKYIKSCQTYEGGFGQRPNAEAHGGATYCAVASLWLLGLLHQVLDTGSLDRVRRWCLARQKAGFSSRTCKDQDVHYTFWDVATLQLLEYSKNLDAASARQFVKQTQAEDTGGFRHKQGQPPDHMTSFFGLGVLSLLREKGLQPLHPALNLSQGATQHLRYLHYQWLLP